MFSVAVLDTRNLHVTRSKRREVYFSIRAAGASTTIKPRNIISECEALRKEDFELGHRLLHGVRAISAFATSAAMCVCIEPILRRAQHAQFAAVSERVKWLAISSPTADFGRWWRQHQRQREP